MQSKRSENDPDPALHGPEHVLDAIDDLYYRTAPDGTIRQWNDRFQELTGDSREAIAGKPASELFDPGSAGDIADAIERAAGDDGKAVVEATLSSGDDEQQLYEFSHTPLTDEDGRVSAVVGIGREIQGRTRTGAQLEALVDRSADVLGILSEEGRFRYLSPATADVLGYDPAALEGEYVFEYVHPDDRRNVVDEFRALVDSSQSQTKRVEYRFEQPDGSWTWLESVGADRAVSTLEGYVITTRDISEKKANERELERQNGLFRKAQAIADVGAWETDVERNETMWTEEVYRILDIPKDFQSVPEKALERYHPEDRPVIRDAFERAVAEGESYDVEVRLRSDDGTERWARTRGDPEVVDGDVVRVQGTIQDISERKRQKSEIEHARKRFQSLFEEAPEAIVVHDVDGNIHDVNAETAENLGYSQAELRSMNVVEFEAELGSTEAREVWREMDLGETRQFESTHERRDGSTVPVEVYTNKIELAGSVRFLEFARNISERVDREREIRELKERLDLAIGVANIGVWEWDMADVVDWDESMERLLGLEPDSFQGTYQAFIERVHPEDRDHVAAEVEKAKDTGDVSSYRLRMETEDGEYIWIEARVDVSIDEDGAPVRAVGVAIDITDRKEQEEEIRELKDRYQRFVEYSSDIITHIDEDGTITYQNPAIERLLGFDPDQRVGEPVFEYIHPDERPEILGRFREFRSQDSESTERFEFKYEDPDGSYRWLEAIAVDRTDTDTGGYLIYARDVSERKEREQEIQELKERLELAVDGANIGVWDWDYQADELQFDDRCARMFGDEAGELEASIENWHQRVHPDDIEALRGKLDDHIAGQRSRYDVEHRIQTADGDWKWARIIGRVADREDGAPRRIVGIYLDIDERKRQERQLKLYREIVNALEDPIMLQDQAGSFRLVNDAVTDYAGCSREALIGANESLFMDEESAATIEAQKRTVIETEDPAEYEVSPDFDRTQRDSTFSTKRYPHYDIDGTVSGTLAICREITDLKERETQMQVVDRILRHNVRNVLTPISLLAELVSENGSGSVSEAGEKILAQTDTLETTTSKAREITRVLKDPPEYEAVELTPLVRRVGKSYRQTWPDAELVIDEDEAVTVSATEALFKAIEELLHNAIVHNDKETTRVELRTSVGDETASITIVDNGPGIPNVEQAALEEGKEINNLYHGTGLGLWLVYWIVHRSGGTVAVAESDSNGSTVTIELPVSSVEEESH
jgi:PAS domain S-box-containing protein